MHWDRLTLETVLAPAYWGASRGSGQGPVGTVENMRGGLGGETYSATGVSGLRKGRMSLLLVVGGSSFNAQMSSLEGIVVL